MSDTDNNDVIVLPDNIFIKVLDLSLQEMIQELTKNDDFFAKVLESIKHHGPVLIKLKLDEWSMNNRLLFFQEWCYVLSNDTLK